MKDSFGALLDQIESQIKTGHGSKAQAALRKLNLAQVPRNYRLRLAGLARRVGFPLVGLRALNALVRPLRSHDETATDAEVSEYAACLNLMGASKEASQLLSSVDPKKVPQALLFQSFVAFSDWDYAKSIPLLQLYIDLQKDPYLQTVGKVNLLAAYVVEAHPKEKALLEELVEITQKENYQLLRGNVLELGAQLNLRDHNFRQTEKFLQQSKELLSDVDDLNSFYVRKWSSVLALKKSKNPQSEKEEIFKVRQEATERRNWESVRDCDFHWAEAIEDKNLLLHLYFGSPAENYRKRIEKIWGKAETLPENYILGSSPARIFSVEKGSGNLKRGQLLHRAVIALTNDLYQPLRLGGLYAQLFPHEHFHPQSSPTKIHQCTKRLRQWSEENGKPFRILENHGGYSLEVGKNWGLDLSRKRLAKDRALSLLEDLCEQFPQGEFTTTDVTERLQISRSACHRLLRKAMAEALIETSNTGPRSTYRRLSQKKIS